MKKINKIWLAAVVTLLALLTWIATFLMLAINDPSPHQPAGAAFIWMVIAGSTAGGIYLAHQLWKMLTDTEARRVPVQETV